MSIEITTDTDWLRAIGINSATLNGGFGMFASVNLKTDDNAKRPVLMLSDNVGNQFGIMTKTDGTTLRLEDAFAATNTSPDIGSLVVNTPVDVGLVVGSGGAVRGYVGAAYQDISSPRSDFDILSAYWGTTGASGTSNRLLARYGHLLLTRFAPNATQVALIFATLNKLTLFDAALIAGGGTCIGTTIAECIGTLYKDAGVFSIGMSNTTGAQSSLDRAFASALSGSDYLDIA